MNKTSNVAAFVIQCATIATMWYAYPKIVDLMIDKVNDSHKHRVQVVVTILICSAHVAMWTPVARRRMPKSKIWQAWSFVGALLTLAAFVISVCVMLVKEWADDSSLSKVAKMVYGNMAYGEIKQVNVLHAQAVATLATALQWGASDGSSSSTAVENKPISGSNPPAAPTSIPLPTQAVAPISTPVPLDIVPATAPAPAPAEAARRPVIISRIAHTLVPPAVPHNTGDGGWSHVGQVSGCHVGVIQNLHSLTINGNTPVAISAEEREENIRASRKIAMEYGDR